MLISNILVTESCPIKGILQLTDGIEPTCYSTENDGQMVALVSVNVSYNCLDPDNQLKLNISLGFGYTCLQLNNLLYTTRQQHQLSMCHNITVLARCHVIDLNYPRPVCSVLCLCSNQIETCDLYLLKTSSSVDIAQVSLCDIKILYNIN